MAPSRMRRSNSTTTTTTVKVSQTYSQNQKGAKCNTLAPVLEHCEVAPSQKSSEARDGESRSGKPLRMLAKKLRDGYVKLMNDWAGAGLSGMSSSSSLFACRGAGGVHPTAADRMARAEREREVMIQQALQKQAVVHPRHFTAAIA